MSGSLYSDTGLGGIKPAIPRLEMRPGDYVQELELAASMAEDVPRVAADAVDPRATQAPLRSILDATRHKPTRGSEMYRSARSNCFAEFRIN